MRNNHFCIVFILICIVLFVSFFDLLCTTFQSNSHVGIHYIIDIDNIQGDILYNNDKLIDICDQCLDTSQVNILNKSSHAFSPQGLTLLYLLAESHFSLHSWPEEGKLRIDFFSCTTRDKCDKGLEFLKKHFQNGETIHVDVLYR